VLTRCPRCDQAINALTSKRIVCPRCATKFDKSATQQWQPQTTTAPVPVPMPVSQPPKRPAGRIPSVGTAVAIELIRSSRSTRDVPRGKPGDHKPVDRAVCSFCDGRGVSLGRTCSKCRGYGYDRPLVATATIQSLAPRESMKTPKDSSHSRSPKAKELAPQVPLSPESEMTPLVMKEAQKLISVGWRPFDIRPGLLFNLKNTGKTKKVATEVWSAIYRMKGAGPAD
jgi:hypothetical protein